MFTRILAEARKQGLGAVSACRDFAAHSKDSFAATTVN
jgi:hypothetical protein